MENNSPKVEPGKIPFWRDVRVLRVLFQGIFLLGVILLLAILYRNMLEGLRGLGLTLNLNFFQDEAGFGISEGITYDPSDTYLKAFWVGVLNTLKVSIIGIVCATFIGLFFGIARLSSNWLIRTIAAAYVECFRNVPLLLQIVFWYTAVVAQLPNVRESLSLFGGAFINNRGVYLPSPEPTSSLKIWLWFLGAGLLLAVFLYVLRWRQLQRLDRPGFRAKWALPAFLIVALCGWFLTPGRPFTLDLPALQGFNYQGGMSFSPEFSALLVGLSIYTSAFIAEVVRSGIQSVVKGQREAARSVGLKEGQTLRLVVLPQAVPIIVPPLTSQYLNLAKNSSLAVAIGFPDLLGIGRTMMLQTGQSIPVFAIIMVSYLVMSLTTSAAMNWYNRRITRIGR
ncbi:ABC transporter permease subunit [Candidatus Poribacteria bacterium]|nr:ABC transporter permease subunit [Candidatus Poribacteria bacterium]MYH81697.1 ABC transporter permease subunit [Candidatus Poribacteria bacterium]MYK95151.1 ABC transporter permease subunit [Candidatus Poribacteria bacterium]